MYSNKKAYNTNKSRVRIAALLIVAAILVAAAGFAVSAALKRKPDGGNAGLNASPPPTGLIERASAAPSFSPVPTPTSVPTPTPAPYEFVRVDGAVVSDGMLALVNYDHAYLHTDGAQQRVVPIIEKKSAHLLVQRDSAALEAEVIDALNDFADAFYAQTGGDRLFVTSAYRTVQYQKDLYAEYAKNHGEDMARLYVASPGCSEHHTGLAVDLSTMSAGGERIALINHAAFEWVGAHCSDYGFILRYPVGSDEVTHVAYEPWHFRYIGKVHAAACTALGMLYEDYITHLSAYDVESGMLHLAFDESSAARLDVASVNALPSSGYLIYTVMADALSAGTDCFLIPLPTGCSNYSISGSNDGFFIITVEL